MVYANSQGNSLYALDANTGRTIWSYEVYSSAMMAPAVANGIVYVGAEDGVLYALDAVTGRKLWSQESKDYYDFLETSPVVAHGLVYLASTNSMTALDAVSGQVRWATFTIDVQYTPTVANGVVYLTSIQGHFSALDASTGKVLWSFFSTHCCGFAGPALVVAKTIYINSVGGVLAMDANTHRERWFHNMNGTEAALTASNNRIYVVGGDRNWKPQPNSLDLGPDNQELDVLDATTGKDMWYYPLSGLSFSTPAVSDGVAYVGAQDGTLYALLPPG